MSERSQHGTNLDGAQPEQRPEVGMSRKPTWEREQEEDRMSGVECWPGMWESSGCYPQLAGKSREDSEGGNSFIQSGSG